MNTAIDTSILGKAPLKSTLKVFGIIGIIPLILVFSGQKDLIIYGVIAIVVFGLPYLWIGSRRIGESVRGNGFYKDALAAVGNGALYPSFVGRGRSCMGIAIVDEKSRQIYINGETYSFDDVEETEVTVAPSQVNLDIKLRKGAHPNQRVVFDNEETAKSFQQRVHNTLRSK